MKQSDLQSGRMDPWQHFRTGDFKQRWDSSKLIVRQGRDAIAPLLALLGDPTADSETHWFTIRALGHFPEPEVIAALAAQIGEAPAYVHRTPEQSAELSAFSIETLAAMGGAAIDVLSQLLQVPQQRLLAAKALNQVRSSGVIPAMISIATDGDERVRYYAIDALGSFHSDAVTPVLLAALSDPDRAVRKAAVMALGRRRDLPASHQLSQRLQPLLWDIDLAVSTQTALALGRLGADDTITALEQVLLSEHTPVVLRIDTVRALAWWCDRPDSLSANRVDRAFTLLAQALGQFSPSPDTPGAVGPMDPAVLVAIVRVLGNIRCEAMAPKASQILIEQLQRPSPLAVTQAVIMALANLGQPQTFDVLLPLLTYPADAVAIHVIAALKRLDPEHSLGRVTTYLSSVSPCQSDILKLW
ncbi:MAG: HEAT repeat domain-containing protein [Cyanobacteria bacterium P01_D01_bin.2]